MFLNEKVREKVRFCEENLHPVSLAMQGVAPEAIAISLVPTVYFLKTHSLMLLPFPPPLVSLFYCIFFKFVYISQVPFLFMKWAVALAKCRNQY